jgi:hypothetical protein
MFKYWSYLLLGENETGKTTFQRCLIRELNGRQYEKLPRNKTVDITHPRFPRAYETLFTMNRSYQEQRYKSVADFFKTSFDFNADISVLSSHVNGSKLVVTEFINELHSHCINVSAVFFSNGFSTSAKEIAALNFDERLWVDNPVINSGKTQEKLINEQIERRVSEFTTMLIARSIAE